jgi:ATP-binding cassette, subfamily B, bacterial
VTAPQGVATSGTWQQLWRRISPRERKGIAITWLMGAVWSTAAVGAPYAAGVAVNQLHRGRGVGGVAVVCCVIAGLALGKALALRVRRFLIFATSSRVAGSLRERLYRSLHDRDAEFFDRTPLAEVLNALGDDAEYIEQFGINVQVLFNNVVWTALIVAVLIFIDPLLAAVSLAPLPLVLILALRFLRVAAPINVMMREDAVEIVDLASDAIAGISVVKGLGLERRFIDRLDGAALRARLNAERFGRVRARYTALIELIPTFSIVIVFLLGLEQVRSGHLTLGGFTAFISYIVMAVWPLRFTANSVAGATRARIAVNRIVGLESPGASVLGGRDQAGSRPKASASPIALREVGFSYEPGHPVLRGTSLLISAGEVVAITGATGSGKTTVLRLIAGELTPDSGTVSVDGVAVAEVGAGDRAALISMVGHDEFLFGRTVTENLAFAASGASDAQLERAAELAIFAPVIDGLEEGWNTVLGERAVRLSGGQRQRAALARGIVSPAGVLLLDDVTSALDIDTRAEVAASLTAIRDGRTLVMVTSEPALLAAADRVLTLEAGGLRELL